MTTITVIKRNEKGDETWRYQGELIQFQDNTIQLEAVFDRESTDLDGLRLVTGDRFIETYYTDRWYNLYEVHSGDNGQLRGWYCNVGLPAEMDGNTLSYVDLALDLIVFPDGRQVVLDEDEFEHLDIPPETREMALAALAELQEVFRKKIVS